MGHEVAALEVELARRLAATASPVAALEPRVEPRVYERDGFAVTFWTYYEAVAPDPDSPATYADALQRLHAGMRQRRDRDAALPDRVAEAERLVATDTKPPRSLRPTGICSSARCRTRVNGSTAAEPPSSCCTANRTRQPSQHPGRAAVHRLRDVLPWARRVRRRARAGRGQRALSGCRSTFCSQECRRLVLAMVAAWRWDVRDEFPNGHQHGRDILTLLRQGPPWPALGALASE